MSPQQIRAALNRPPVFGDVEQITALKILRQGEAEEEALRADGKKKFSVTVECSWEETVEVWAKDDSEARDLAKDAAEGDFPEYSFYVRELNPE